MGAENYASCDSNMFCPDGDWTYIGTIWGENCYCVPIPGTYTGTTDPVEPPVEPVTNTTEPEPEPTYPTQMYHRMCLDYMTTVGPDGYEVSYWGQTPCNDMDMAYNLTDAVNNPWDPMNDTPMDMDQNGPEMDSSMTNDTESTTGEPNTGSMFPDENGAGSESGGRRL